MPLVGSVTLEIIFSNVLFPAPFRPRIPITSPWATSKLISSRAQNFRGRSESFLGRSLREETLSFRIRNSRKFSRLMDRPSSYSFERWFTSMMGNMENLIYQLSEISKTTLLRCGNCARILQCNQHFEICADTPKALNLSPPGHFSYLKLRGKPFAYAILGGNTYL